MEDGIIRKKLFRPSAALLLVTKIPTNEEEEFENWAYFFSEDVLDEEFGYFMDARLRMDNFESGFYGFLPDY